jgi:putative aldouronate transport system permease protein
MKKSSAKKTKYKNGDKIFTTVNTVLLTLVTFIVLYPLINILSSSLSDPYLVGLGKVWLLPKNFTIEGYKLIFLDNNIMLGYANTFYYTVFGTVINLSMTLTAGYALANKTLPGKKVIMVYLLATMYFSGGLIPLYLLVRSLGLINSRFIILIISAVSVYNLIIARTFFQGIPKELEESAMIDGSSTTRTFLQIVLPLSKALIGVMVLFYGIEHWNSYFSALIFLSDRGKMPLQIFLREILVTQTRQDITKGITDHTKLDLDKLKLLLKYTVIVVSSLPVLIIYPFLQKYFDKGVLLGSLKG